MDFLKGLLATQWFAIPVFSFSGDPALALWGLPAAVLGHTFPLFTGFKGGKGVATTMGGLLGVMPWCLLIGLVTWVIVFYSTRYVALASIGFGLSLPICAFVFFWTGTGNLKSLIGNERFFQEEEEVSVGIVFELYYGKEMF